MKKLDGDLVMATLTAVHEKKASSRKDRWSWRRISVAMDVTQVTVMAWARGARVPSMKYRKAFTDLVEKVGLPPAIASRWKHGVVTEDGLNAELVIETLKRARKRGARTLDLILHFRVSGYTIRRWGEHGCAGGDRREAMVSLCEKYGMKGLKDEWTS